MKVLDVIYPNIKIALAAHLLPHLTLLPNAKLIRTPPAINSRKMATSSLLFFLVLSAVAVVAADNNSPAIFLSVCGANKTSDPEGFDVHFVDAMEQIFQNITKSGFATSVSGSNLTVYGLGQCFTYLSPVNCQLCYAQSRVKVPHCLPASTGRIYLDGCFLEYADRNVSSDSVDSADAFDCGNSTVSGSAPANFVNATAAFLQNLTVSAIQNTEFYDVGSIDVSPQLKIYAMAQCWRSLNASGCRNCLEKGRQNLVGRCLPASSVDAKAMNAGCFMRYSTTPFYLQAKTAGGGSSSSVWRKAVVALSAVVAVLAVVGIAIFWRWRKSPDPEDDTDGSREIIRSITQSHLSFKYEDLREATCNFSEEKKLGQGGYGSVYKGTLPDGREVAVKRLFFNTRQWVDQFFNEVTLINQVQHKNLVKLLGCSVEGPESLLIYELLYNTSLDHFLFGIISSYYTRRIQIHYVITSFCFQIR
ncbi:Cysteine-rich receptor-like protein kinase 3 [Apostasia shenzhenica]|uniref:Cysteine-rich receptor-like protein kinase 3 n=1 Tax=Apostasia shenzhenica TaxID=1088818 RepID=A0A2I0AGK9_9ASPA|nr:Cysteine-rich receptor-like protein kinase 3 [Apostasia shenzhenica]